MESNKERNARRDLAATHAWLTALQSYALARGHHVDGGKRVSEPDADPVFDEVMAQVIGQLRAGYRPYNGSWSFSGWPKEGNPYPLLTASVPREYRWLNKETGKEIVRTLGEISPRKVLLAAAQCAGKFVEAPVCQGPLAKVATLRYPGFLTYAQAKILYDFHLLPKENG